MLMKSLFMIMIVDLVIHNRNLIEQRHKHKHEISFSSVAKIHHTRNNERQPPNLNVNNILLIHIYTLDRRIRYEGQIMLVLNGSLFAFSTS